MKRFEFRFAAVAKVRRVEMERQARALAEAQAKERALEKQIEEIQAIQKSEVGRLKSLAESGQLSHQMMEVSEHYRNALKKKQNMARHQLRDCREMVERERQKLIEKEKARQVMEKVREKDYEAYIEEGRRDETQRMDEISSMLWDRFHKQSES
jgi:flagellar FliJ protein